MGHKKGKRKREKECVEKALSVGGGSDDGLVFEKLPVEDFPFDELGFAVSSGMCPFCGSKLESSGDGLVCPNGDWGCTWF